MSSPATPSFRLPTMNLHIIAPIVLLGTGSVLMVYWYFSSNEFLDAGFPPRAAEAFRIASVAADDWQLRHAIRYYRKGIEIAIAHGISPFDDRILWIKGKMMSAIKREEDIGLEREVLEEIKEQAVQEIRAGNVQDRGKLVALAVQASLSLAAVSFIENITDSRRTMTQKISTRDTGSFYGACKRCSKKISDNVPCQIHLPNTGDGYRRSTIEPKF